MRRVITLIIVLLAATNCFAQFSRGYYRTHCGEYYHRGSYGITEYDYDFTKYECADTNDTVIMIDGEEYEMFVYPTGRSFDKKNHWGNKPLDLPKWIQKMVFNDVMEGKKHTEFLVSPNFGSYENFTYNGLSLLYGYKIVLINKANTNKITKTIVGKGGGGIAKLGDFTLYLTQDLMHGDYKLSFNSNDEEEFDAVKDYLIENKDRLGIMIEDGMYKVNGQSYLTVSYYMNNEWIEQAEQLETLYKNERINSLN